jgi:GT2 family glycosyltransferase
MNKEVSAVIINHNNGQYLDRCIKALLCDDSIKEVIVVDDASTDNSTEVLLRYPVKVLASKRNIGPVAARNMGAREATGQYLFFLDADAQIGPRYARTLAEFLEDNEHMGIVTGKIISEHGVRMWFNFGRDPHRVRDAIAGWCDRIALSVWRIPVLRKAVGWLSRPFSLNLVPDDIREVDWVVEMACMTRRDIFQKVNGWDEGFFMFFEGPDLCRRIRAEGFSAVYLPAVFTQHLGGHSHSETRGKFFAESRKRYFKKYS